MQLRDPERRLWTLACCMSVPDRWPQNARFGAGSPDTVCGLNGRGRLWLVWPRLSGCSGVRWLSRALLGRDGGWVSVGAAARRSAVFEQQERDIVVGVAAGVQVCGCHQGV
jgi:hypothetical protein